MPLPLIDRAPGNDVTSLTTYTTHTRVSKTNIYRIIYIYIYTYIYIYICLCTLNPVESNHRNGPTAHKNYELTDYITIITVSKGLPWKL